MKPVFVIAAAVYVLFFASFGIWSGIVARRQAGPFWLLMLKSKDEVSASLAKGATSRWDPLSPAGKKKWRFVFIVGFVALGLILFLS